ncbi:MAG: DUF1501 domain-containing protein [Gemmataceae bacterium]|nr:DUF1501 domain-containing protein [Gemmataceae bacterium]
MLRITGPGTKLCDGISRRTALQVGALGLGGLTLPDLLRGRAQAAPATSRPKSVIMIWLRGGPSHIDSFDMKPEAPKEIRGEFKPIASKVPGIQVCEYLPLHGKMMDKLAIIRGIKSVDIGDHTPHYMFTGFPDRGKRPVFGAVVSKMKPSTDGLPPYVSLMYKPPKLYDNEGPTYLGPTHRPFVPKAEGLANLFPAKTVSIDRLENRMALLKTFDGISREVDFNSRMDGIDTYHLKAMEMISSAKVRDAFDWSKEKEGTRDRYGKYCESLWMARRLVEAGVPVITAKLGDWDTHEFNFRDMKDQLPQLDKGFHALISDLHDRGLDKDVAVVLWGEFGRAPKVSRGDGRDHWPEAGAAVLAGGGFKTGQVIGETDSHGGVSKVTPYTPANILATLYNHLGVDTSVAFPDHQQRPMNILDDRQEVRELLG